MRARAEARRVTWCTVIFDTDGGLPNPAKQKIKKDQKAAEPQIEITKSGFTFSGWYKEKPPVNPWNFETDTISGNTTLYAKWDAQTGGSVITIAAINGLTAPVTGAAPVSA